METSIPQPTNVRGQIFYWLGMIFLVVNATVTVVRWANEPAQAVQEEVRAVDARVRELEKDRVTKNDFNRLESKVDTLLVRTSSNPN